jgi:hypothetical protein
MREKIKYLFKKLLKVFIKKIISYAELLKISSSNPTFTYGTGFFLFQKFGKYVSDISLLCTRIEM